MTIALDRPYCTLSQVQQFVGNTLTANEDRIKEAINRASRFVDEVTGMVYYKKTVTAYYLRGTAGGDGWEIRRAIPGRSGGGLLVCPLRPIVSVTSIEENGIALTENSDFYVREGEGIIERAAGNWSEDPRDIKITVIFGYNAAADTAPAADQPGAITQFAIEIAARMSGLMTRNVEQQDGTVVSFYETAIPKWIVDRLESKAGKL